MTKKQLTIITVLTVTAITLGLLISRQVWMRFDLTANRVYTISPVSRALHTEIEDTVHITYYLSDRLLSIHPMPGQVIDFLRVYASYSRGRIRVNIVDPARAGIANIVQQMGIQPHQLEDQESVSLVYAGIVIEYLDGMEVLPVVFSLDTLEYDLTSRIRSLITGRGREVGIIVGDMDRQWATDYQALQHFFHNSGYTSRVIIPGMSIPDTLPALFILGGAEDLDDWTLYLIDRYIQNGGNVLFAVETIRVNVQSPAENRVITDQGLLSMISYYGATIQPSLVLDRASIPMSIPVPTTFGTTMRQRVTYPFWITILERNVNRNNMLTANFNGLDLFWASPIEMNPPENIEYEVLFSSTEEAWLMTRDFSTDPRASAFMFEREVPDTVGQRILGVTLSGVFPSYFEGVDKPVREWSDEVLPDMPTTPRPARIIVIGNTEFAVNSWGITGNPRSLGFLRAVADWLGQDPDIVAISTRQGHQQLDRIADADVRRRAVLFSQGLNVVIIPLGVIVAGVIVSLKRKAKTKAGKVS